MQHTAGDDILLLLQARYRGARAALRLEEWDTAKQLCAAALDHQPDAQDVQKLLQVRCLLA